jgi:hypothetical protein
MFKNILISVFSVLAILYSQNSFSQEIAPERTIEYSIKLNKVKRQTQVDSVTYQIGKVEHVTAASFDWGTYLMVVKVNEGGAYASLSMEEIKAILIKNNATLVNFTKKAIK